MSACKIQHPETYDEVTGMPVPSGLVDPRLGIVDKSLRCGTCDGDSTNCQGHFGHIELAKPVYHPGFIGTVKRLLEIVCVFCGKMKLDPSTDKGFRVATSLANKRARFAAVWALGKTRSSCLSTELGGCGLRQPKIRREGLTLQTSFPPGAVDESNSRIAASVPKLISPEHALRVLSAISDADCALVGLSMEWARPEWLILTVLPVPPPQIRPAMADHGAPGALLTQDDLTYKLSEIVKVNSQLARHVARDATPLIAETHELLMYHVATMLDNSIAGIPPARLASGRTLRGLRQRLKGKEGRLRGNLMGKRVEFSARTVITGDPFLSLSEVGVPLSIAQTLTFPEQVTRLNFAELTQVVARGARGYPGANRVVKANGNVVRLDH
ncbi:DNA-directed RNA polymerase II subunit rpb1, partial [Gonapodya sp. JEL0774]